MVDTVSIEKRREIMQRIRSTNSKPELLVRSFLHKKGFRFRLHAKGLPGRPDIVLPRYRTVIFVHGCFWHRHEGCRYSSTPKSNVEFWQEKFDRNVERDRRDREQLQQAGYTVIVVWECELKTPDVLDRLFETLDQRRRDFHLASSVSSPTNQGDQK